MLRLDLFWARLCLMKHEFKTNQENIDVKPEMASI